VIDHLSRVLIMWLTCVFLVLMVAFTIYTVVMRYVFHNPPFWGDTVALFCNIWFVLVAYALAVRDREDIASEFVYEYLPRAVVSALHYGWQLLTLSFGVFLAVFGARAALDVPGQYWELGGLPKQVPMMVLPIAGVLVTLMSAITIVEDALGWRTAARDESSPG
jgi:TRAP-type C4-dicarboxylate transport system permease small subunit